LARASILKQLKRTDEANECMQTAKNLDPAVGKYVKDWTSSLLTVLVVYCVICPKSA